MKALNHSEARQLIEQAADGPLTASEQRALESHLQGCADCRAYAAEFAALEAALGATLVERWGTPQLTPKVEQNLVNAVIKATGGAGWSGKGGGGGGGIKIPGGLGPWLAALLVIGAIVGGRAIFDFRAAEPMRETAELVMDLFESFTPTDTPSRTPTMTRTATITATESPSALVLIAIPLQNVNCREGNGNSFEIADTLFEGVEYTPIARGRDNLWVQFRGPITNVKCWVFVENINLLINEVKTPIDEIPEALLPFVNYPPTPTPTFTASPEPVDEPAEPSDTPTTAGTLPQCSDGVDNDQDGAIDQKDRDCATPSDNNEFD